MAIKKLQNNFTTPEQSKRLLELGVPADSADCVRVVRTGLVFFMQHGRHTKNYLSLYKSARGEEAEPCWSVGRLIEIWLLCNITQFSVPLTFCIDRHTKNIISLLIKMLEKQKNDGANFSKLED